MKNYFLNKKGGNMKQTILKPNSIFQKEKKNFFSFH